MYKYLRNVLRIESFIPFNLFLLVLVLAGVQNLKLVEATETEIEVMWEAVEGANSYTVVIESEGMWLLYLPDPYAWSHLT